MAHPDVLTAQERSARVLATLLSMRLPEAQWSLTTIFPEELSGYLCRYSRTPEQSRADLTAWATAFNADVDWGRHGGRRPETCFTINGITVCLWIDLIEEFDEEEAT